MARQRRPPGVAKGLLRAAMKNSAAPRNERWHQRYDDIGRLVDSANDKFAKDWAEPKPFPKGLAPVMPFRSE